MPVEDSIQCVNCGRAVVPQILVDTRNKMHHPIVMHLCPFCGVVLRESGGQIDRGILAILIGSICLSAIIFIFLLGTRF